MAPIVRVAGGARELVMARWGMPGPPQFGGQPVTNIRNVKSPHWRRWLGPASRCVVPATSFCEYADTKPRKTPIWFALGEDRPLFAFAGLWTPWKGVRGPKSAPVEGDHELFGFLTTEAERGRRARSPEGDAGHPDDAGGGRPVALGRDDAGARAAAAAAGRRAAGSWPGESAATPRTNRRCRPR